MLFFVVFTFTVVCLFTLLTAVFTDSLGVAVV